MSRKTRWITAFGTGVLALSLTACGGGGESGGGGGSASGNGEGPSGETAVIGVLMAFSGPTAIEGQEISNGCLAAEKAVNDAGGVLGSPVSCEPFDTRGTPSEAVPAARQMLSTASNLFTVLGPSTAESVTAVPVLEEAKQTHFSVAGDGRFDQATYKYFHRLITSDSVSARAMGLFASDQGHQDVALVFTSGASAQANVPPLEEAAAALGLNIVVNMTVTPEQPSYRTEVTQLVSAQPDVIIYETEGVTNGTFLADLVQAGGQDIPLIANVLAMDTEWQEAALAAYGSSEALGEVLSAVIRHNDLSGDGFQRFNSTLESLEGVEDLVDFATFGENVYSRAQYDGVIVASLAATKANSLKAEDYNAHVKEIFTAGEGKTLVTNYADGLAALEAGEDIHYVGASDEISLNEYNNVNGVFAHYAWDVESENVEFVELIDPDELAALR